LAGGVWSRDLAQAHRIARNPETATVWVNRHYNFRMGTALGGYKQSGFSRELGRGILDAYTITKSVVINLQEGKLGLFG
jgi:aldehyde dehydrogenase